MKTKTDRKWINFAPFLERFRKNRFAPRPEAHIESLEPCNFFAFCHIHWLLCSPHFRSVGKESLFMKDWCHLSFMKVIVVITIIAIKKSKYKESDSWRPADLSVKKRNPSSDFSWSSLLSTHLEKTSLKNSCKYIQYYHLYEKFIQYYGSYQW